MSDQPTLAPRFRGAVASDSARHVAGALVVGTIVAVGLLGLIGAWPAAVAFFAVGAGAGYSLSGSV